MTKPTISTPREQLVKAWIQDKNATWNKTFMPYVIKEGPDQPAFMRSLIFVSFLVCRFNLNHQRILWESNKGPAYFILFYFFWFGFYGPFRNISLISSRSFIKCGRRPENPGNKHLIIRKQNLASPHLTRARLEPQRWETLWIKS